MSSHQLNSKTHGVVLLFKIILWQRNCFLSSVGTGGKDENGLKFEKNWVNVFQILKLFPEFCCYVSKNHEKVILVSSP